MKARGVADRLLRGCLRLSYTTGYAAAIPSRWEFPYVLNGLRLRGDGAEVGVHKGIYSQYLLRHWKGRRLYSIDPWIASAAQVYPDGRIVPQEEHDALLDEARRRLAPFATRSEIVRLTSRAAASHIADGQLDFVYIDAVHTCDAVREDITLWFPKIRQGGILAGHDYLDGMVGTTGYGVKTAVDEFCAARGLVPYVSWETEFPSWFVRRPRERRGQAPRVNRGVQSV